MLIEIHTIAPVIESAAVTQAGYQDFLDRQFASLPDVRVVGRMLATGPSSVENEIDDALAVPGVLRAGIKAQEAGAHGVLIDCMLDPGLRALRCALDIPVMGAAEIVFHLAATLGHTFGVVDVCDDTGPMVTAQVRAMGLGEKFAGVRGIGLGVEQIEGHSDLTLARLVEAATLAIKNDGADVIVLGCTELSRHADVLRLSLRERKLDAPVINPTCLAVGTLIAAVRAGVLHSKRSYPTPTARKTLRGHDLPQLYDAAKD